MCHHCLPDLVLPLLRRVVPHNLADAAGHVPFDASEVLSNHRYTPKTKTPV